MKKLLLAAGMALLLGSEAMAQSQSGTADVEAWLYLGRHNQAGSWAPPSRALRLDAAKDPKRVTVVRDAVLVDNIDKDTGGGDAEAAKWTRVVRRGAEALPLIDVVRQDSVGDGKLVWGKVRVAAARVEVIARP